MPAGGRAEEDALRTVEKSAEKWVDLRTEAARLEDEWSAQKPLLESFVQALRDRGQSLEAKRDFLTARSAKDTEEAIALETANRAGVAVTEATDARVKTVAAELLKFRVSLPPRLSAALEMSYRTLAKPEASVNERAQAAFAILGRCALFNRDISSGQEALALPGEGGERVLEVIYWGLGQGYALDRSAGKAWIGRPAAAGWTWQPRPEAVAAVTRLIAIQQDKADPAFVALPAELNAAAR